MGDENEVPSTDRLSSGLCKNALSLCVRNRKTIKSISSRLILKACACLQILPVVLKDEGLESGQSAIYTIRQKGTDQIYVFVPA